MSVASRGGAGAAVPCLMPLPWPPLNSLWQCNLCFMVHNFIWF